MDYKRIFTAIVASTSFQKNIIGAIKIINENHISDLIKNRKDQIQISKMIARSSQESDLALQLLSHLKQSF